MIRSSDHRSGSETTGLAYGTVKDSNFSKLVARNSLKGRNSRNSRTGSVGGCREQEIDCPSIPGMERVTRTFRGKQGTNSLLGGTRVLMYEKRQDKRLPPNFAHFGWGLLRMSSAPVSFLHSRVFSHLAQALATSMLSATKNRCGMGSRVEPLVCREP